MHTSTVEDPAAAIINLGLDELFGPETGMPPLPPHLQAVVNDVTNLGDAKPGPVVAIALATLAIAMGPRVFLPTRKQVPVVFNVVVTHNAPRTLPWMDAVIAPFLWRILAMQEELDRKGITEIATEIKKANHALEKMRKSPALEPGLLRKMQTEADQAQARLQPFLSTSCLAQKDIRRLLAKCFDRGLTVTGIGRDIGNDFLELKKIERVSFEDAINRSWNGVALGFGQHVCSGNITMIWQTQRTVRELLSANGFNSWPPVPVLFLTDIGSAQPLSQFASEPSWQRIVHALLEFRCRGKAIQPTIAEEATAELNGFAKHMAGNLEAVLPALRPYVSWLPELAPRLAQIFHVLGGNSDGNVTSDSVSMAVAVTKWLGRQHATALGKALAADTAAVADKKEILWRKIRDRSPISRRDLRRTFNNQSVRWFDDALDSLIEGKCVRYNDCGQLIPCR